ncbi:hypothetical protein [Methylovirgula sp. 4M-Z18]|uniref:hypothetical protein n=1 Tax=Methylovirgula sp. 4M-Z18 TaxID=2293567 RepID=UPI000E2EAC21|nr:hypothetical protein [Methylovirgula sp. 4M-Z18]RFB78216.1 hypothetical protein DYH55_17770 [Methylovirgula sp. 4M-Z18]
MASGFHAIHRGAIFWLDRALLVLFASTLIVTAIVASIPARAVSGNADAIQAKAHMEPIDLR